MDKQTEEQQQYLAFQWLEEDPDYVIWAEEMAKQTLEEMKKRDAREDTPR